MALIIPPNHRMQSTQLASDSCNYCNFNKDGEISFLDDWMLDSDSDISGHVELSSSTRQIWYCTSDNGHVVIGNFKVNFCPKCGCDLRQEDHQC